MSARWSSNEIARIAPFYGAGLLVAYCGKLFYSRAGADELVWILAPTCRLAELLTGMHFERETRTGWISHAHHMIVGPGCAGLNFLIIAFSALFFSFVHRLRSWPARSVWLGASLGLAYVLTVTTNSLRIIAAIRLHEMGFYGTIVTPERVHRAEGTAIYCLALLLVYLCVGRLYERFLLSPTGRGAPSSLVPLGWYLAVTLGAPLLDRAYQGDPGRFLEHSVQVVSICLVVALAGASVRFARRGYGRRSGRAGDSPCLRC